MNLPILLSLALALGASARPGDVGEVASKPNIVLILIDNVGYGDLGCYGNPVIKTPNLDRLAREGVRCTNFYIASPSCSPSRGGLLTGRHPERTGFTKQMPSVEGPADGLNEKEILLPRYLKPAGYATACYGKWNIGFRPGLRPPDRGFDEFFGHKSGSMDYYAHVYNGRNDLYRGNDEVKVEGYSTDLFADAACDFIRSQAGRPFFLYVPFNAAHYPNPPIWPDGKTNWWPAPKKFFDLYGYREDETDQRKRYRAVLSALDDGIGRVVAAVDGVGLKDKTIVLVISDNGAFMLKNRGLEVASNAPLRDGGVTLWEGGLRVPCLVRWPGRIKPGSVCREMLSTLDIVQLAARVSGVKLPSDRVFDGRDPLPALAGEKKSPHECLFFRWAKMSALRSGDYKLIRTGDDQPWQLYDLSHDLAETHDVAGELPQIVAQLRETFERWDREVHQ